MTIQRQKNGNRLVTRSKQRTPVSNLSAQNFPTRDQIQKLEDELNAFNERIVELEDDGHESHAMDVLKANAMDFARRIDELRGLLVESATKDVLSKV